MAEKFIQKTRLKAAFFAMFYAVMFITISGSQAISQEKIQAKNSIIVKGNERIDEQTILKLINANSAIKKNDQNFASFQNNALKKLYESELFSDSKIYLKDSEIVVEVTENPLILDVKFVGNSKVEDEMLQSEISLKKRSIFTKAKLQNDLKRINEIYLKSGRFLTKIEPKIIQKEQNRIELIFDIFEGKKANISEIYFVGNESFTDEDLKAEITTKQTQWWKFLSSADTYDSDRIEFDKEKLRRFYGSKGYADFATISAVSQITPTKDSFFITFLLEEGIKYKVGEVKIVNQIKKFDESILQKEILVKKGKIYNSELVDKTVDSMSEIMSEKSYAFSEIQPVLKRNREEKTIDISFVINETPPIYIEQISISGNTRTLDEVIRRELRFREGDAYNINKINRSKQRLENLAFFEKVEFNTKRIGNSNKVNLEIVVKEKKTGELNLGVGYSTVNRLSTNIGIRERNLMGTGQDLGINVQRSFANFSGEINYTKPYFMDRAIDVGIDVFKYDLSKRNSLVYDQSSNGTTLRAGYAITEYLTHQIHYSLSQQTVSNVDSDASVAIKNLEGSFLSSAIGHSLTYDKRDNRINPKSGYYISLSQELAGFGGDIKTLKNEGSAGYYIPTINENFILKFQARGGIIEGLGQDVRSNYSFFLGGNNFRGFEFAGIGPRAVTDGSAKNGSAIGGKIFYVGTTEFMFPLGLPKELGINGILFNDIGTLKGVDPINKKNSDVSDSGSLRSAYGLSIVWASPMGPIRLDFAKVAKKEDYDQTQAFRFSFGTSF